MTTVYVAMICDRHTDPEPFLFTTEQAAIDYAKDCAQRYAGDPAHVHEQRLAGWTYYARYGPEGDSVWVLPKEVNGA